MHVSWLSQWRLKSVLFSDSYMFVLYIMISRTSLRSSSRLYQYKCCNMSPMLDMHCCLLVTGLEGLNWYFAIIVHIPGISSFLKGWSKIKIYMFVSLRSSNWCEDFCVESQAFIVLAIPFEICLIVRSRYLTSCNYSSEWPLRV